MTIWKEYHSKFPRNISNLWSFVSFEIIASMCTCPSPSTQSIHNMSAFLCHPSIFLQETSFNLFTANTHERLIKIRVRFSQSAAFHDQPLFDLICLRVIPMHRPAVGLTASRKVVLLGNSGVGKTSLAQRFLSKDFDPSISSTIGPMHSTSTIDVDGIGVNINLWDTAGQEQFRSIVPLYIRGSRSAIIVASVDSIESFHSIPGWVELLNSSQEEPVRALLAVNKTDLRDPLCPEISPLVDSHRRLFAACFFVSALTGDNVEHLFREVARLASRARSGTEGEGLGSAGVEQGSEMEVEGSMSAGG
jgi:small GTP-binding protein